MKVAQLIKQDISSEEVQFLIQRATLAPSGDNCQPWCFVFKNRTLFIYHDSVRAAHPLNHQGIASILSLGTVIESIRLASSEIFFNIDVKYISFSMEGNHCWAEIKFYPQGAFQARDPLVSMLGKRCTDRRLYQRG